MKIIFPICFFWKCASHDFSNVLYKTIRKNKIKKNNNNKKEKHNKISKFVFYIQKRKFMFVEILPCVSQISHFHPSI